MLSYLESCDTISTDIMEELCKEACLSESRLSHLFKEQMGIALGRYLVFGKKAKKSPIIDWGIKHGCYAYEAKDAYSYAKKLKLYDLAPVADKITQDMLILGANGDHFIDYTLIGREINMLKNVRSLTFRLFTDKEDAQNHCNVGNGQLTIDVICDWIEHIDRKKRA